MMCVHVPEQKDAQEHIQAKVVCIPKLETHSKSLKREGIFKKLKIFKYLIIKSYRILITRIRGKKPTTCNLAQRQR